MHYNYKLDEKAKNIFKRHIKPIEKRKKIIYYSKYITSNVQLTIALTLLKYSKIKPMWFINLHVPLESSSRKTKVSTLVIPLQQ